MAVFNNFKAIAVVLQEAGKIKELQQLLSAQKKLLEMQEKIRSQSEEIRNLKEKLGIKANLVKENNAYWIKTKDNTKKGPFCTRCQEKDSVLISLHPVSGETHTWYCPECKNYYSSKQHSKRTNSEPRIIPGDDDLPVY